MNSGHVPRTLLAAYAIHIPTSCHDGRPSADEYHRQRIADLAQAVLNARAEFPGSSLADLYDVDAMAPALTHAHHALDAAVDKLYRSAAFTGDRERVEHLFKLYEGLILPPLAPVVPESPRARRVRPRRRS